MISSNSGNERFWRVGASGPGIPPSKACDVVVRYHGQLAEADRKKISTEFLEPDSVHRIVVATDAMRLGIDNPDSERVVNWDRTASLCHVMQCARRAAREKDLKGEFIWFLPQWCFLPRGSQLHD